MTWPVGFHRRRMDLASQAQASPLGFVVLESGCPPLHEFACATSGGGKPDDISASLRSSQLRGTGEAENFAVVCGSELWLWHLELPLFPL